MLITGANKGIGFEIVKELTPTHHILLGSRDSEQGAASAAKLQAKNVQAITIDVTSDASISAAASSVATKFSRLDVLINNARIANDDKHEPGKDSLRV